MSDFVTLTIDGLSVSVSKGTSIIEAAKQAGVLVPHYCYHPSLPSPAVCRMCLVEVEKAPKLMPACVTTVAEGQVVHTDSASARKAREGVLEFLLINHPLDCPICDQAGECELQNYVFQEGRANTRYSEYAKRFNPVEDFGPDILYVTNRCILCTRCVRFMDDVAGTPVLNVSNRGDRACIGIDESQLLDHPWAGNVVDLCPVGSLLSKDFLHKARAWDLDHTASVCTGCSQGCNVTLDTRDSTVVRIRPRPNLDVNRHFICDTGRMHYRWMNRGDRIEAPLVRMDGRLGATDWDAALGRLAALVGDTRGPVVILASAGASVESLGLLRKMVDGKSVTAAVRIPIGRGRTAGGRAQPVAPQGARAQRDRRRDAGLLDGLGRGGQGRGQRSARPAGGRRADRRRGVEGRGRGGGGGDGHHGSAGAGQRRAGAAHHQRRRGARHLRQSRRPRPALPAGEERAGDGASGLVDRGRDHGPARAGGRRRGDRLGSL